MAPNRIRLGRVLHGEPAAGEEPERGEEEVREQPDHREPEHETRRVQQQRERARAPLVKQLGDDVEEERDREPDDGRGGRPARPADERARDERDDPEREHHADDVPEPDHEGALEVVPAKPELRARDRLGQQLEVARPAGGDDEPDQQAADDPERREGDRRRDHDDRIDDQRQRDRPGGDGPTRRLDRDLAIKGKHPAGLIARESPRRIAPAFLSPRSDCLACRHEPIQTRMSCPDPAAWRRRCHPPDSHRRRRPVPGRTPAAGMVPFRIAVPQVAIDDLRQRLAQHALAGRAARRGGGAAACRSTT